MWEAFLIAVVRGEQEIPKPRDNTMTRMCVPFTAPTFLVQSPRLTIIRCTEVPIFSNRSDGFQTSEHQQMDKAYRAQRPLAERHRTTF